MLKQVFGGVLEGFWAEGAQSAVGFMLKTVLVGFQRGFGRWAHKGASKARFVSEFWGVFVEISVKFSLPFFNIVFCGMIDYQTTLFVIFLVEFAVFLRFRFSYVCNALTHSVPVYIEEWHLAFD